MAEITASPRTAKRGRFVEARARLRSIAVATFAGLLCGAVALGVGARLAMRVVALVGGDIDAGKETDAGFTVGDVTAFTIFLAFLGGAAGTFGGMLYAAMHRRLAWAGRWRGLAFGGLVLGIFGSPLIEGSNPDFAEFGIPIVNVVLFAVLFLFFGILIALVYDDLERAVAPPSTTIAGYALFAAQGAGVLLLVPATAIVLAALIADGGEAIKVLLILAMFAYLLIVQRLPSLVRQFRPAIEGARRREIIMSVMPLGPPVVVGVALDVRELLAIF
jgi:hypothetical protein